MRQNLTAADLPPMSREEKEWWENHNSEYYHYLYRIDNISNGRFYYGIHSQRIDSGKDPENDGYMGSGRALKKAQNEEGLKNFTKTIVKTFSTRDEARLEEMKVVDKDLVDNPMCYNLTLGGGCSGSTDGLVPVDFKSEPLRTGKFFLVTCEEYWKNRDKYIKPMSDMVIVKERGKVGGYTAIPRSEYINNTDLYESPTTGKVTVNFRDIHLRKDRYFSISKKEYEQNKDKYITVFSEKIVCKNINNPKDIRTLLKDDPLILSGEFVGITKGTKQSQETISKKSGSRNGSYKTMWITDGKEDMKLRKGEPIPEGWRRGRVPKKYRQYINTVSGKKSYFICGEQGSEYLPAIFFKSGKILSFNEINDKYNELGTWDKVHKFFHMERASLKELREYYEAMGHKFKKK